MASLNKKRRTYGEHLTPVQIFKEFILPEIKDNLYNYTWVDLFAGEGNLILPILELIPENERVEFFKKHIFLFEIQKELVEKAIQNAVKYGIPKGIAAQNILQRDTIKNYPKFLLNLDLPIYHITNPPYLYIGYIVKHKETQKYLEYFQGINEGYQDMTTYKYSNSEYTRKYLGLSQVKKLIQTFPWLKLTDEERTYLKDLIKNKNVNELISFVEKKKAV
ncbi:hypothetical protein [Hydrogenothermus marinus]|uniref:Uncharacterized protein n=1 Tax=Hydrogenothermus marinus TaxID=133270 RepID=A0A3M0BZP7_9AQUI|nr:hypothetical protein [Hydrogenothermus marinus]RMB00046.1 hypothetical protein CLV39_0059 [Hydrogenothermus marinus]